MRRIVNSLRRTLFYRWCLGRLHTLEGAAIRVLFDWLRRRRGSVLLYNGSIQNPAQLSDGRAADASFDNLRWAQGSRLGRRCLTQLLRFIFLSNIILIAPKRPWSDRKAWWIRNFVAWYFGYELFQHSTFVKILRVLPHCLFIRILLFSHSFGIRC